MIKSKQIRPISKALAFVLVATCVLAGTLEAKFQESPGATAIADQDKLHKKLVLEIYEATKTAKTAKHYSAILELCENTLSENLSKKNRDYVTSLSGWARARRGQERFELALNLERVGNGQSKVVKKEAMGDFDESLKADPKRYRSWMARGIAHSTNGDHVKAALDFTEVVKLKTDYANGWFNRAESLYHLNKFENAIEDYSVVLRMNSDDAQAFTGRAHCYLALKRSDEALQDYERVVELQPTNPFAFLNRGDAYADKCQWQKSLADYEKSSSLKRTATVLQRMAWLKATCSDDKVFDPRAALSLSTQAIDLGGKSAVFLDTYAAAQAAMGEFESAKATQENAIRLAGAESEIAQPLKARLALYEEKESYKQQSNDQ